MSEPRQSMKLCHLNNESPSAGRGLSFLPGGLVTYSHLAKRQQRYCSKRPMVHQSRWLTSQGASWTPFQIPCSPWCSNTARSWFTSVITGLIHRFPSHRAQNWTSHPSSADTGTLGEGWFLKINFAFKTLCQTTCFNPTRPEWKGRGQVVGVSSASLAPFSTTHSPSSMSSINLY